MPDVGQHDLAAANDVYNARLAAAGVPDDGFAEVPGGYVHGGLFDSDDALSLAEDLAVSYRVDDEGLEHYEQDALGVVAMVAVHGMAIGVLAERARWDATQRALGEAVGLMREARGHYGIEETAGPGGAATEWDDIANRMQAFVWRWGAGDGQAE